MRCSCYQGFPYRLVGETLTRRAPKKRYKFPLKKLNPATCPDLHDIRCPAGKTNLQVYFSE